MKSKRFQRSRRLFGRVFNLKYWSDWDRIKGSSASLGQGLMRFFVIKPADHKETFESAVARWQLNESQLLEQQKALFRLSVIMLIISMLIFCYFLYNLYFGYLAASILSVIVCLIGLVLAFRYHYWQFLIKARKLKCSLGEWYKKGLLGQSYE